MATQASGLPSAFICQRVYTNTGNIDLPTGGSRRPPELPIKFVTSFWAAGRLHNLYSSPNIIRVTETRIMTFVGHVIGLGKMRIIYSFFVGKTDGKKLP